MKKGEEDEGFELSHREKVWKEQMEAVRRRIESDPYEAIFGKRFEPFWGPLVPSWMREEMGLPVWSSKMKETAKQEEPKKTEQPEKMEKAQKVEKPEEPTKKTSSQPEPRKEPERVAEKKMEAAKAEPEVQKPSSYAYASSTSWDSWTNKTRRVEWDSVSGQTKKFEYDPISNRMVLVETPKQKSLQDAAEQNKTTEAAPKQANAAPEVASDQTESKAVNIPIKQSTDLRKSIPIPPPLSMPSHSIPIGFTPAPVSVSLLKNTPTALAEDVKKSTAIASDVPKPSALAKISTPEKAKQEKKEKDLESLTADDVRASMGKIRTQTQPSTEKSSVQTQVDALLSESKRMPLRPLLARTELESLNKKKEKLLKDERGLFHIERQKRELEKLDRRIQEVTARVERLSEPTSPRTEEASQGAKAVGLQSSLERMQSKGMPQKKVVEEDADDAAAHESTEPIESSSGVPKDWAKQADLLQADRVRRSAIPKSLHADLQKNLVIPETEKDLGRLPSSNTSAIDEAKTAASLRFYDSKIAETRKAAAAARRAADEAKAAEEVARIQQEKQRQEREKKLEKANQMLESEVQEQKFRMQAHENRYAHKIRALRQELEMAYKQSTVHSDKHLERIRYLEAELQKAMGAGGDMKKAGAAVEDGGARSQAEGDLARGVTKWYQQAASTGFVSGSKSNLQKEMEKAEQKKRDRQLVKEIREIYEKRYGVIDTQHQQLAKEKEEKVAEAKIVKAPQVVEVESDVDLGEALAKYEKDEQPYRTRQDGLERELQAREREVNEGVKLVDDKVPKLIPTELAATKPPTTAADNAAAEIQHGVQWAEPPLYKVLAYDSGNNILSTATTTSNFTGTETPISIPEALGQLYNPASFVSSFAELQREGYQIIYGAKDLLVFRKVKEEAAVAEVEGVRAEEGRVGLEDHGLAAGEGHPDHWAASPGWMDFAERYGKEKENEKSEVNPIDGTSSASKTEVETEPSRGESGSATGSVKSASDLLLELLPAESKAESWKANDLITTSYQDLLSAESKAANDPTTSSYHDHLLANDFHDSGIHYRHYPRVKREEYPVFTGTKRKWNRERSERSKRSEKHERQERRKAYKEFKRARGSVVRTMLGFGVGGAGVMYFVGAAAEKRRKDHGEDWARKARELERWREG